MKRFIGIIIGFCFFIVAPISLSAQTNSGAPLVIVVHGIGGGNRDPGWSRDFARAWGVEVHEVTFRYKNRDTITSYVDFQSEAGDWALSVQNQMKEIVRQNPGRRVMIVAHSWGMVATKMALGGGMGGGSSKQLIAQDNQINAITPGEFEVEELVGIGAPLGEAGVPEIANEFLKWRLVVPDGRPSIVKHWTNVYDVADPISSQSHNLPGADSAAVEGSGYWWDKSGITAHMGIWTHPEVSKYIHKQAERISQMGPIQRRNQESAATPTGLVRFVAWDKTNNQPLPNTQVSVDGAINSPSEKFRESGTTNADGTVDIPGISLGVYTIAASHAPCSRFESGLTNLKPYEVHRIIMECPAVNPSPTPRRITEAPTKPATGVSEDQIVAEYRSLLPIVLEKNKKPWHTRVNLIANAVKQGNGYRVNYQAYCIIEQGPDKGKDYMCSEFDTVLDLGGIKATVADMKRQLGR